MLTNLTWGVISAMMIGLVLVLVPQVGQFFSQVYSLLDMLNQNFFPFMPAWFGLAIFGIMVAAMLRLAWNVKK